MFVFILALSALLPVAANAARVFIEIGDRPYYSRGPWYWERGVKWVWVPGHWGWRHHHRVWIHGHYRPI